VLVVLEAAGDDLVNPSGAGGPVSTGVTIAQNPGVPNNVDASALVLSAVANDEVLLHNIDLEGVITVVIVVPEVVDDIHASTVAALVAEDDALLLEAAVVAEVEVLTPSAVLGSAVSAISRAEVLVGTGADLVMNPVKLGNVDASAPTLLLNTCVDRVGAAVSWTHEAVDDIDTSGAAAPVAENDVQLLNADVEGPVPPAMPVNAVLPMLRTQMHWHPPRLRCLRLTESSCLIQPGQKCGWTQELTLP